MSTHMKNAWPQAHPIAKQPLQSWKPMILTMVMTMMMTNDSSKLSLIVSIGDTPERGPLRPRFYRPKNQLLI